MLDCINIFSPSNAHAGCTLLMHQECMGGMGCDRLFALPGGPELLKNALCKLV
eukprot:CAMPEP_0202923606 /NCGR_PEP_ID=MMETSP1392-20130828/78538_1 /ASSEMBLY_ACC=CAM_ASM_000868 /TAXON_ID=225041 /ORGANISM="Chlamydomonas chlamydogama, Strain SAG 11-48b" /LENGTH=52 /DNA_ID=CAMNT_0049617295 /DNA_START=1734 /DNA_END=1889 /DNA_ORIENTATION=-